MKVERSSVDQVKARFEALKKKKDEVKEREYSLKSTVADAREEVWANFLFTKISSKSSIFELEFL